MTGANSGLPVSVLSLEEAVCDFARASKSAATRLAYQDDAADFTAWCESHGLEPLPASVSTVAAYLAGTREVGTHGLYHHAAMCGYPLFAPYGGIRVTNKQRGNQGGAREHQAFGRHGRDAQGTGYSGGCSRHRGKRALTFTGLGFAGAFRRSGRVALEGRHFEEIAVCIRMAREFRPVQRSRSGYRRLEFPRDRIKKGGSVTLERLSVTRSVAQIIKGRAEAAGFDPTLFSGHSLRWGFVTSALPHGADILRVMDVIRHREVSTLKTYDRRAKAFKQMRARGFCNFY